MDQVLKRRARVLLLIDLLAAAIAFMLAMLLRYGNQAAQWQQQLYSMLFATVLLTDLILYLYRERSVGTRKLTGQDPVDSFIHVVKNSSILILTVIGILFLSQNASKVSRLVLGYFYLQVIAFDYVLRMAYRHILKQHTEVRMASRRILIVTVSYLSKIAVQHLQSALDEDMSISGMALLDASRIGNIISGVPITGNRETLEAMSRWEKTETGSGAALSAAGSLEKGIDRGFTEAYIYLPYSKPEEINSVIAWFEQMGVDAYLALSSYEDDYTENIIEPFGVYRAALYSSMQKKCKVLGVRFSVANVDSAVMYIRKHIESLRGKYLCFCNVHTTVMSRENEEYQAVQNGAAYTFPDGMPIAKVLQSKGFPKAKRVAGPDFMDKMFLDTMDGKLTHYFYGSTQETLDALEQNLKKKYPGIVIKGMYSPPFRPVTPEEDAADIARINESGADIIWIGLGAPKQENWMAAHKGKVNGIMVGVGAGFNFHADTVKRAPRWVQRISMEWFYRLLQEPKKLFGRYFVTNTKFVLYLALDMIRGSK